MIEGMLTLVCLIALAQQPQNPDKPVILEAMKQLDFLVGEWEGEGWHLIAGKRETSKVNESVKRKAGGTVLAIEGLGKGESGNVVHEAFAVVTYDVAKKEFRFRSYLADGRTGDFVATVKDGTLTWSIPAQRPIRYTIKLDAEGRWSEAGEIDMGNERWTQFFEMKLSRKR